MLALHGGHVSSTTHLPLTSTWAEQRGMRGAVLGVVWGGVGLEALPSVGFRVGAGKGEVGARPRIEELLS